VADAPTLNHWRVIHVADTGATHLIGIVHGHPELREGARAITSAVQEFAPDFSWARTQSRIYQLLERGEGDIPAEWCGAVDFFLKNAWHTASVN
jgi:hypothetical protein